MKKVKITYLKNALVVEEIIVCYNYKIVDNFYVMFRLKTEPIDKIFNFAFVISIEDLV